MTIQKVDWKHVELREVGNGKEFNGRAGSCGLKYR